MDSTNANVISALNTLIETCKDGQEGFRTASEDVPNSELKSLFSSFSLQRSKFAGELQSEVIRLGEGTPEQSSSLAGSLHRGWINLKAAILTKDEHSILAECERGEDVAVSEYKKALEQDLPAPLRELVQKQAVEVRAAHDKIRDLRDARAKK